MSELSFQPLIPSSLWLALAAAAVAMLVWYAWRRPASVSRSRWTTIAALMSVAIALVLLLLLNPIRVERIPPPPGKPLLTVLVDATASMNTPDMPAGGRAGSRYEAAAAAAASMAEQLSDRFDVRLRTFAVAGASAVDAGDLKRRQAAGRSTDLGVAISASMDTDRPQGQAVVLFSDGAHNAGEVGAVLDAARLAKAMAAPVYTHTFGGDAGGFDLGVELRSPQELAFIGQRVLVTARVSQVGLAGSHPNVLLMSDGKEIARQQASLDRSGPAEVKFWVSREKTGIYPYEVRVEPLPGEMTQANNAASYLLRVIDQPIRVLQIEGKPYWDSKFLLRALAGVPAVEMDSAVRIADGRIMWRTIGRAPADAATQPTSSGAAASISDTPRVEKWKILPDPATVLENPEGLKNYQIIVIGRDAEPFLTDAAVARLQNWVTHDGGALVCYRGSPTGQASERLAKLLPVQWQRSAESRFHLSMTEQGRDLHWLADAGDLSGAGADALGQLPTLAASEQTAGAKPLAIVLARSVSTTGDSSPAVIYQPYGAGRVVVIEGSGMWRWAFMPPQYQKQETLYAALWHSLVRWLISGTSLMPGQKMSLRADRLSFGTDEPASMQVLVREEAVLGQPPTVELTADAASAQTQPARQFVPVAVPEEAGAFRVNFGKLNEGRYHARLLGARAEDSFSHTVFDVRRFGEEELNLKARPDLMGRIAQESGGSVLDGDNLATQLADRFTQQLERAHPPRTRRTTAWDRWWVLSLVIIAWTASWWVRRSGGLV